MTRFQIANVEDGLRRTLIDSHIPGGSRLPNIIFDGAFGLGGFDLEGLQLGVVVCFDAVGAGIDKYGFGGGACGKGDAFHDDFHVVLRIRRDVGNLSARFGNFNVAIGGGVIPYDFAGCFGGSDNARAEGISCDEFIDGVDDAHWSKGCFYIIAGESPVFVHCADADIVCFS